MLAAIVGIYMLKLGRRRLLIWGPLVQSISMFAMYLFWQMRLDDVMIIPVLIFNISFVLGIGGLNLVYTTEVVLPRAIGICVATQYLASSIIGKVTPFLMDSVGPSTIMFFYSVTSLLVCIMNTIYVVETQGKTDMEIFYEIKNMKIGGVLFADKKMKERLKLVLKSTDSHQLGDNSKPLNPNKLKEGSFYFKEDDRDSLKKSVNKRSFPRIDSK